MKKNCKLSILMMLGLLFGACSIVKAQLSQNTVKYEVTYDISTQTYTAWVIPNYSLPSSHNSGTTEKGATAQFTLVVPKDFVITQITDIKGTWSKPTDSGFLKWGPGNPSQNWPGLDPALNYYVVGKTASETDYGPFVSGTPVSLFSFKGNGCYGVVKPLPPNDPFISAGDATLSLNVGNSFYSRSGQPAGGNVDPLEQFVNILGTGADCNDAGPNPIKANPDNGATSKGVATTTTVLTNDRKNGALIGISDVTMTIESDPANGTVSINSDGTIKYTPNATFVGVDCYVYKLCDKTSTSVCDTAKVCITVTAPVRAIFASNDNNITNKGVAVSGNVLINDNIGNGTSPLVVTTTPIQQPANGTVTLTSTGGYTYTPNGTFTGIDNFKYRICDSGMPAVCDTAIVSIIVRDPSSTNNPPIALNDNSSTKSGVPVSGNVLLNDTDLDAGQTLTATKLTNPTHGTLIFNPDGSYTYTPTPGYVGSDKFTYKVCDNGVPSLCSEATVDLNVYDVSTANLPPTANADVFTRTPTGNATGNLLGNDTDPENQPITINPTPVVGPTNGTVTINADGTFTYVPNAGYTGADMFTYEICDNYVPKGCSQAVVFILTKNSSTGTADLKINKRLEGAKVRNLNETISYKIVVRNLGPNTATNVIVKDSAQAGVQILSGSSPVGTFSAPLWNIPSLASGDSAVLTVTAKPTLEGTWFNFAMIKGADQADPVLSNNTDQTCVAVPIRLCTGQAIEVSVPTQYTNVKWMKDGVEVSSGVNTYNITSPGNYTYTATNVSCPSGGCCPYAVVSGGDCCPITTCVPASFSKKKL
jgi:uncharacterized repeat protein (TIGR01451 family)